MCLFLTKSCHNFFLWQYIMKLLYLPFAWIISWMISSLPFSLIFFFSGSIGWIDPLISSHFYPIFHFSFFSALSHSPIYTLTLFSNPSLDFFISAFMFYIPMGFIFSFQDCSFFLLSCNYSTYAMDSIVFLSILVCEMFSSPSSLVFLQFVLFSIYSF